MEPAGNGAYPPSWDADVVLADGHTVHVRPILPDDGPALVRFHHRQSPESIYLRYFSPRPELSRRDVEHLTHVDHVNRVAFVAVAGDELIAVARYERYRGTDTAEVAFFVDDDHHGRGLATLLLEFLVAAALENGLTRLSATTLPHNRKMLRVFASAGYEVASRIEDGVVEVAFEIDPTGPALAAMGRRERAAEAASVRPILAPGSVAVVGAGKDREGLGAEVFRNLLANGFTGALYPVNRDAEAVEGIAAHRSVAELPEPVDLAVIATPAEDVPGIVEDCGRRGVRSVVVLSAGFSEAGAEGARLERAAVDAARRHGLRLLGPNCLGLINTDPGVRLDATLAPSLPPAGRVAVLAEAGTLSAAILDHAERMELGLSTMATVGNRADVSGSDLLSYWIEDPRTDAVLMYLAARQLPPRFVRAARAAASCMPVAALNTSMAVGTPSDRVGDAARRAQAMFRQTGVISVGTLEQLFDVGRIVADQPVPAGRGVVVVGNSDGAVALAADACVAAGLELVPFGSSAGGDPSASDGPSAPGPVDLGYTADAAAFAEALGAATADERVHSVIVVYTPARLTWDAEVVDVVLRAAADAPQVTFAATMLGAAGRSRLTRSRADGAVTAVPIFRFPEDAATALGRLAAYGEWRRSAGAHAPADVPAATVGAAARSVLDAALLRLRVSSSGAGTVPLDPDEQWRLLGSAGVEVIERSVVAGVDEAVAAAQQMGWPVALKAATRDRLTRSVASGVVLDLDDEEQLRSAWARMSEAVGNGMLPAVVQRFADSGLDVAVEVHRDDDGAGTVRVGLGGPAAILDEFELGVLPLSLADASSLVAISPVGRVLTDPLDRVPLVELVHRLATMVESHDGLRSVRADPIVVSPMWARVADVDIEVGEPIEEFAVRRLD